MRTKTLLLIAAVAAAAITACNAQVYSVNAVGYVNTKVPAKAFALVSNPLTAATNTIEALFAGLPNQAKIYSWNTTSKGYDIATYDSEFGWDYSNPAMATLQIKPGGGVFVNNPSAAEITITFVGEVPQGKAPNALVTTLLPGFQIVSSQVPQAGDLVTVLGYTPAANDKVYQWKGSSYVINGYDTEFGWDSGSAPVLGVGEAIFLSKVAAGTWTREFTVSP